MANIKKCTVSDLQAENNFTGLLDEYAQELVVDGAPPFSAKMEMYHTLEQSGALKVFGAYMDDKLIGFVTVLATVFPHTGVIMAATESLFVSKSYRKGGAGLKLIKTAESSAREQGSPCLFISAPFGGILADVLPHVGYVETNRMFFRKL